MMHREDFRYESAYEMCSTEHRMRLNVKNSVTHDEIDRELEAGAWVVQYTVDTYNNFDAIDGECVHFKAFDHPRDAEEYLKDLFDDPHYFVNDARIRFPMPC